MKNSYIREYFLAIAHIPILMVLLLTAIAGWILACMERYIIQFFPYVNLCPPPRIESFTTAETESRAKPSAPSMESITSELEALDDEIIDMVREFWEDSALGIAVQQKHSDRHLYAVLKPTRGENIQRLQAFFNTIPEYAWPRLEQEMRASISLFKAEQELK